jgi:hypothetical protein
MNLIELQRALRQLRCSGMATGLETRLLEAQTDTLAPIDFLSTLVQDELLRRQDRLLTRLALPAGTRYNMPEVAEGVVYVDGVREKRGNAKAAA